MLTKQEAALIDKLLDDLIVYSSGARSRDIESAKTSLEHATEGMQLPKHLAMAKATDKLPRCEHRRNLMDWSGEQLVPPCGCRLVEPG